MTKNTLGLEAIGTAPFVPLARYRADQGVIMLRGTLFSGGNFLSAADQTWTDDLTRFSFCCSFMPTASNKRRGIVRKWRDPDQKQFAIEIGEDNLLKMWIADALTEDGLHGYAVGSTLINQYQLYNLAVGFDGSLPPSKRLQFYLNGEPEKMKTDGNLPTAMTSSQADLTIGQSFVGGKTRPFEGAIWRFGFWAGTCLNHRDAIALHNHRAGYKFSDLPANIPRPSRWYDLGESSGLRVESAAMGSPMNGTAPSTQICQWRDLFNRGNLAVAIDAPPIHPTGINGRPAFNFPADPFTLFDLGYPSGQSSPASWTVYAVMQSEDTAEKLQVIHVAYRPNWNCPPESEPFDDVNCWCGITVRDNWGTDGSLGAAFGNGINYSLVESDRAAISNNVPFYLTTSYSAGDNYPTMRLNGSRLPVTPKTRDLLPKNTPANSCEGPAGPSSIGNIWYKIKYRPMTSRLIGEVIIYGTSHTLDQVRMVEAQIQRFWNFKSDD